MQYTYIYSRASFKLRIFCIVIKPFLLFSLTRDWSLKCCNWPDHAIGFGSAFTVGPVGPVTL